jgi:two-component system, OmpR family, sensor histidine kinase KdpD
LYSHWSEQRSWTDEDIRHMQQLTDQAATTIYNILLFQSEAEARKAAEQANELKMRFLAMISHELRTPLASIKGFATSLLATDVRFSEQEQRDFIEIINDESDKLQYLIEQLLDLTRMQTGSFATQPEVVAIDQIVDSSRAQLQSLCTNHQLAIDIAPRLPRVNADKHRIGQVLTNLIHNACKFSQPHSHITISAAHQDRFVRVDVSDEGPGVPIAERESIFQPFHQVEGRRMHSGASGLGLGLAIARGIVEAHGGDIWVQDREAPGTTMSFTLPIASDHWQERFGE